MYIPHPYGMSVWVRPASKDLEFQNFLAPMQTNNQPGDSKCKVTIATTLYHVLEKQSFGDSCMVVI